MKPGRNPWSFFMQKNNENLGKNLFTGIALITNIVSNVINMIYLLKEKE